MIQLGSARPELNFRKTLLYAITILIHYCKKIYIYLKKSEAIVEDQGPNKREGGPRERKFFCLPHEGGHVVKKSKKDERSSIVGKSSEPFRNAQLCQWTLMGWIHDLKPKFRCKRHSSKNSVCASKANIGPLGHEPSRLITNRAIVWHVQNLLCRTRDNSSLEDRSKASPELCHRLGGLT